MKNLFLTMACLTTVISVEASVTYKLTVTNGSAMPLSPSVVYSTKGATTDREIGNRATDGFMKICRDGNAPAREAELASLSQVIRHQA